MIEINSIAMSLVVQITRARVSLILPSLLMGIAIRSRDAAFGHEAFAESRPVQLERI
jgi:hypothetical protein